MTSKTQSPITIDGVTAKLRAVITKFAGNSDTAKILQGYTNIDAYTLISLLESSLHIQQEELKRLRSEAKRVTRHIETLSQQQLI